MIKTHKSILLMVALFVLAFSLSAQSQVKKSVPGAHQEAEAKSIFNMLLTEDFTAVDKIFWDDFYLNDEDITYYYYDSLDYGDDDEFTREIVSEIYGLLHYKGDAEDKFTDWVFDISDEDIIARCINKRVGVEMSFYTPADGSFFLREIRISTKD